MKHSLLIPVFQSYEVVRRQILYMNTLNLPDSFEVIMVDDGSRPPIFGQDLIKMPKPNFNLISAYRYKPESDKWTKGIALNIGARAAAGEYIQIFAIDHIMTQGFIDFMQQTNTDCRISPLFKYGEITKEGKFKALGKKRLRGSAGAMAMRKDQFMELGGFDETLINKYPTGDDLEFEARHIKKYGIESIIIGPEIYGWPKELSSDVCPWTMEEDIEVKREEIFYSYDYLDWKTGEAEQYWEEFKIADKIGEAELIGRNLMKRSDYKCLKTLS